jgi:hypothetical protein
MSSWPEFVITFAWNGKRVSGAISETTLLCDGAGAYHYRRVAVVVRVRVRWGEICEGRREGAVQRRSESGA